MPLSEAVRNDEPACCVRAGNAFSELRESALAIDGDCFHHALGVVLKKFTSRGGEEL